CARRFVPPSRSRTRSGGSWPPSCSGRWAANRSCSRRSSTRRCWAGSSSRAAVSCWTGASTGSSTGCAAASGVHRTRHAVEALQEFVDNFTYLGIFAVLLLGSLGAPIPEEMPIVAAGVLSHEGIVRWWLALPVCLLGVLSGDMVLYWVGRHWGERVLGWRLVRLVLSPAREQWLNAAYR